MLLALLIPLSVSFEIHTDVNLVLPFFFPLYSLAIIAMHLQY